MSGLRITGGRFKGKRIAVARDGRARFTSAKVREAIFDLVGDVSGYDVLDLFAGTGSFSIEALSRDAASVTSVEKDRHTATLLRNNLRSLSLDKDCLVLNMDVRYAVPMLHRQGRRFDLVFVDPPYEMGHIVSTVKLLKENPICVARSSTLVFEHSKREMPEIMPEEGWDVRVRSYGDTALSIVRCGADRL